jgi:hypothetical protein
MKTYVVQKKTDYDGSYVVGVFSSLEKAKAYCESDPSWRGWRDDYLPQDYVEVNENDDGYYDISEFVIDSLTQHEENKDDSKKISCNK